MLLWSVPDGALLARMENANAVNALAFDSAGRHLVLGSANGGVRLMNLTTPLFDDATDDSGSGAWELLTLIRGLLGPEGTSQIDSLHRRSFELLAFSMDNSELVPNSSEDLARTNEAFFGVNLDAFRSDRDNFVSYSNAKAAGYPRWDREEITLVPDQVDSAATAVFLGSNVRAPFVVDFEYSIFNAQTGYEWRDLPADGLVFMFLKDRTGYDKVDPPDGSDRAFIKDSTGYGVHFRIFEGSAVELRDGQSQIIASSASSFYGSRIPPVYSDGEWRKVRVGVTETSVTVIYEGEQLLTVTGRFHSDFGGVGIGAANGAANAEHKVRNIKISPEARLADVAKTRDRGFGRVIRPAGETYNLDSVNAYNSAGGPVTASRASTGEYAVRFANLGGNGRPGGNVQITADGPDGNMCKVRDWDAGRGDFVVNVLCFDRTARPVNSRFSVAAVWPEVGKGSSGFARAHAPVERQYTPDRSYAYNSTRGDVTAGRSAPGVYRMRFADLGRPTPGGNVQVTAVGPSSRICNVERWGSSDTDFNVGVRCFDDTGSPADVEYSLLAVWPEQSSRVGGFARANQAQNALYAPSPAHAYNSAGGTVTASRSDVGQYSMLFAGMGGTVGGVQVTAYGAGSETCKVGNWDSSSDDFTVDVRCFDSAGRPADAQYSLLVFK